MRAGFKECELPLLVGYGGGGGSKRHRDGWMVHSGFYADVLGIAWGVICWFIFLRLNMEYLGWNWTKN